MTLIQLGKVIRILWLLANIEQLWMIICIQNAIIILTKQSLMNKSFKTGSKIHQQNQSKKEIKSS